jgi:hypothetical protein
MVTFLRLPAQLRRIRRQGILDDTKIIEVYDGKSLEKTVLLNELMAGARQRLAEDIIRIKHPAADFIVATEPEYGLRKIERFR